MKKIFSLLLITIFLISCSENNGEEISKTPKLLTKIITTEVSLNNGMPQTLVSTTVITYDTDNKLVQSAYNEHNGSFIETSKFIYSNNKLTQRENYNTNNELIGKTTYEYNGENIIKRSSYGNGGTTLSKENSYTYNSNNQVIKNVEVGYFGNQPQTHTRKYEYLSNNQVKVTNTSNNNYFVVTFDKKKRPEAEIPYLLPILKLEAESTLPNNPTKWEDFLNGQLNHSNIINNEYDSDNFLIKRSTSNGANSSYTREYTYNK